MYIGRYRNIGFEISKYLYWYRPLKSFIGRALVHSAVSYLLFVVGGVGQHGGDVEHDLIVLAGGVEGVGSCGVSCRRDRQVDVRHAAGERDRWKNRIVRNKRFLTLMSNRRHVISKEPK